jgi:hypothetical protein
MISQFHFKDYEADEGTKAVANLALSKVLDIAPDDSRAVAILEKQGKEFGCSMEVYSRQGPFMATAVRPNPVEAIQVVEEKLKCQIAWCRSHWGSKLKIKNKNFIKAVS